MSVESADFITQLDITNPKGTDNRSTLDNHDRLVKKVVIQTFPNLNSACTASPGEFNHLVGVTANLQVQINNLWNELHSASAVNEASVRALSATLDNDIRGVSSSLSTQVAALSATLQTQLEAGDDALSAALQAQIGVDNATLSATLNTNIRALSATLSTQMATLDSALSATLDNDIRGLSAALQTEIDGPIAASQLPANGVGHDEKIWTMDSESSWSIGNGGNQVIPEGIFICTVTSEDGNANPQVYSGSVWRAVFAPTADGWFGGTLVSDGTNVRLYNGSGSTATVYYRRLA